jgi:hypothetical protein
VFIAVGSGHEGPQAARQIPSTLISPLLFRPYPFRPLSSSYYGRQGLSTARLIRSGNFKNQGKVLNLVHRKKTVTAGSTPRKLKGSSHTKHIPTVEGMINREKST